MKLRVLVESVEDVLTHLDKTCERDKPTCARYLATLMVLKDMINRVNADDPLVKNTYIDYLFGERDVTLKALNFFYSRIQENPRARRLHEKYEIQFLDDAYGHQVMRYRIQQLRPFFTTSRMRRIQHHQDRLVNNLIAAQDKLAKERKDQYDLTNGDHILDDQTQSTA